MDCVLLRPAITTTLKRFEDMINKTSWVPIGSIAKEHFGGT